MSDKEAKDMATSINTNRFVISQNEAEAIANLPVRTVKPSKMANDFFSTPEQRRAEAKKIIAARKGIRNGN
ncbi:hypothetical protein [Shouchella shacheensis]|uniref:hypothetical protein n=1 Tax=Shouchella shacheensis TaxID=1649580 RepID=UPI0007400FD6|nr:hypothetical protein [Shouchella shacheensis]